MNEVLLSGELIKIIFVLVLVTAALLITQRSLSSLFNIYAAQSALLAVLAVILFARDHSVVLLLIALLTVATKVIIIPRVLRRIKKNMNLQRDLEFRYLTPITSVLVSSFLIFLVWEVFSNYGAVLSADSLFFFGAVIGVSMTLMGMLVIITRKRMITKTIGYLMMENGVLLFGLFVAELPFIIELLIVVDLIILIVLTTALAFGIDSTIEDFHKKLNIFGRFED